MDQGRGREEVPLITSENDIHKGNPPYYFCRAGSKGNGEGKE
jgi:hypothetical protein